MQSGTQKCITETEDMQMFVVRAFLEIFALCFKCRFVNVLKIVSSMSPVEFKCRVALLVLNQPGESFLREKARNEPS